MPLAGTETLLATTVCASLGIIGNPDLSQAEIDAAKASWEKIFRDLFTHLTANIQVSTTVAVTSVSGVTPGPGASGPGVGTGFGTIA